MIFLYIATIIIEKMMNLLPNRNRARSCLVLVMFFVFLVTGGSLRLSPHHSSTYDDNQAQVNHQERATEEVYPTGSSLPDCSHACGPCFPCKRVMVSFKCSVAESCPIVYKCMCKGKYYHVPSN